MSVELYGLKQCDSCRKAMKWLDSQGIEYSFVDIRERTPDRAELARWGQAVGYDTLVNRRSTTWRGLDDAARASLDGDRAADTLALNPTLIKRPVVLQKKTVLVGFDADRWSEALT